VNIIIKNKIITDTIMPSMNASGNMVNGSVKKIGVMFDVIDDVNSKYWVDMDGGGYFPVEFILASGILDLADAELQAKCLAWLADNSILQSHAPVKTALYQNKQTFVDNYQAALTVLNNIQSASIDTLPKCQQAVRALSTVVERMLKFMKERL
jgi:hypothetical protein